MAAAAPPARRLLARLLMGTMAPTAGVLLVFAFLAHEVARGALERELGRRLQTAAAGAAATILPEQLRALRPGDEGSLTYANVLRRLATAQARLGVRRVVAVTPELEARGDTAGVLALGAHAYELDADHAEIARALLGTPASSPLFLGHDGVSYERAYAAVGDPGDVAGLIAVEGDAEYPAVLAAFRRSMLLAGLAAAGGVLLVTLWIARRISGPVTRLAQAAARLGQGDLQAPFPVETRDEIGVLARTFEETRQALKARDERMQMMLAGIAHEVRNPLGGLELYAGLLREALGDQPERLEEVGRIEREVGHLKTVVNDFLEFARRAPPRLEVLELAPLCREVAEVARVGSRADVQVDVPPGLRVRADAGQLRRVLLNLARNAVAAAKDGHVALAARQLDGRVRVAVRDDGPGVPPELKEQIFTAFFTTREKGTGLGLAFVREIVHDHGGEVNVQEADGGGSVFSFELPAPPS
ncbi:MAG TPA: HAMP domain-containing sensor histidine kinase [Polyangia bacterium]|nr:HAMP domain-containing sensor histidine kinase [Polyangia bacterium]